jgi:hypothetical protein
MARRPRLTPTARRPISAVPVGRGSRQGTPVQPRAEVTRELLIAPATGATRRAGGRHMLPRMTLRRVLAMLVSSLVVLLGTTVIVNAVAAPGTGPLVAQPAPNPPQPLPTVSPCTPGSLPVCDLPAPTTTPPVSGVPLPITTEPGTPVDCFPNSLQNECLHPSTTISPCTGEGCLPQPTAPAPTPANPANGQPGDSGDGNADCGITNIGGCITNAINAFFRGIVTAALNPLLDLLSKTLLTTPTPDSLPRIGELWTNSWQILLASYAVLVLVAGILVMSYETLQTRHGIKEVAPRIVVGFLAGALSLWVATKAIEIANALAQAVMGDGLDANSAGPTLRDLVLGSLNGGIFIIFIGIFLAGMLVCLLVTYIVRVALTIILVAGAPIALMCHALPQTEGIARWWWKAFGGCLAIQVGQSLTLITAIKVFLAPGGFTFLGPTVNGLVNLLVALALAYILFKIPFWFLASLRGGGRRSLVGSLVRGFIAYKTFGLLRGRSSGGRTPLPPASAGSEGSDQGRGPADPYARTRVIRGGQYMLPLTNVRRSRPTATPAAAPKPRASRGRQLALPLGDDWPENKPVLGRDGQYRLPLDVTRVRPTAPPAPPTRPGVDRRRPREKQLELPFDPYRGNRPTGSGQYPLPFHGLHRTPRPPSPPPSPRKTLTQWERPLDPATGSRPSRSGQHPLPLDGARRRATPTKPPSATPPHRSSPPAGRQLRLPLDLPKPPRHTPPPPEPGGKS